jgi:hypothetical protein
LRSADPRHSDAELDLALVCPPRKGAAYIGGRYTPGTFTNQSQQKRFMEPRLLIVTDPQTDHQVLRVACTRQAAGIARREQQNDGTGGGTALQLRA